MHPSVVISSGSSISVLLMVEQLLVVCANMGQLLLL